MKVSEKPTVASNALQEANATKSSAKAKSTDKSSNAEQVKQSQNTEAGAKVTLSSKAKDFKQIKDVANNTPDVDQSKVESLKAKIKDGSYKINADKIADKMLAEGALN